MPTTVEVFVESRSLRPEGTTEDAAFAELYTRTYAPLVSYCRRYCPPGYDAEDIAQEAFSRAWSSWGRYSRSRPFWPWVATIARRLCVDYWRRDERSTARDTRAAVLEPQAAPCPDELTEMADEQRIAVSAFRRLRPDHQRIVGLRDIEGWSYEDIARFEGVTVESVRGSLRRARVSLRKSYDHLARGLPIGFLVTRLRVVRLRVGRRLADLQGSVGRSGLAQTGAGELLVTLLAISVAAVTLNPSAGSAVPARPVAGAQSGPAAPGTADPVVPPTTASRAAASGGAGDARGGVPAPVAPAPVQETIGRAPLPPNGFSVTAPETPDQAVFSTFTRSPNYAKDGVVFGAGGGVCPAGCPVLFRFEVDHATGAVKWRKLGALNFNSDRVLLPPAYPLDNRIFTTNGVALQVSLDGGETFEAIAPAQGMATMSPAFSAGDPTILLNAAPGWKYNDAAKVATPFALTPPPTNTAGAYTIAFSTTYTTSRAIYLGAKGPINGNPEASLVYRCDMRACQAPASIPGRGAPDLFTPTSSKLDEVFAWWWGAPYRSVDGGATFQQVAMPITANDKVLQITEDGAGSLYALTGHSNGDGTLVGVLFRSNDGGGSWAEVPSVRQLGILAQSMVALPDGHVFAGVDGGGLVCSIDRGVTWRRACSR